MDTTLHTLTADRRKSAEPFALVAVDLYRDIHKGIRTLLFAATERAGRTDPSDPAQRAALAADVTRLAFVLDSHAEHEDAAILPALEIHLPDLAAAIVGTHATLEPRVAALAAAATAFSSVHAGDARRAGHELYLALASFTGDYLAHQDDEERVVMPALEAAVGVEAVLAIHEAIVSSIPPDEMAMSLGFMLPAMNVDDRTELLGGIKAGAPAEVFGGVMALAGSVLPADDVAALAARLG